MTTNIDIDRFWSAVENWDSGHPLTDESLLNEPVSDAQLFELQSVIPGSIPSNLLALLKWHNGAGKGWYCFSQGNFLSASEMVAEYIERQKIRKEIFGDDPVDHIEAIGPVHADVWREGWIPFLKRNKEPLCIDLDPTPEGSKGQVIEVDTEGCVIRVLAPTLEHFLYSILNEL